MKSKRAKEYLKDNQEEIEINWETGETEYMIWPKDSRRAVELAEEDMANKASNAFCAVHCPKGCPYDDKEECKALREFKRKMEE